MRATRSSSRRSSISLRIAVFCAFLAVCAFPASPASAQDACAGYDSMPGSESFMQDLANKHGARTGDFNRAAHALSPSVRQGFNSMSDGTRQALLNANFSASTSTADKLAAMDQMRDMMENGSEKCKEALENELNKGEEIDAQSNQTPAHRQQMGSGGEPDMEMNYDLCNPEDVANWDRHTADKAVMDYAKANAKNFKNLNAGDQQMINDLKGLSQYEYEHIANRDKMWIDSKGSNATTATLALKMVNMSRRNPLSFMMVDSASKAGFPLMGFTDRRSYGGLYWTREPGIGTPTIRVSLNGNFEQVFAHETMHSLDYARSGESITYSIMRFFGPSPQYRGNYGPIQNLANAVNNGVRYQGEGTVSGRNSSYTAASQFYDAWNSSNSLINSKTYTDY